MTIAFSSYTSISQIFLTQCRAAGFVKTGLPKVGRPVGPLQPACGQVAAGSSNGNEPGVEHAMQMSASRDWMYHPSFTRGIAVKRFPVALLLAVVTVASLTVASPANADTSGPIRNFGNQKCLTPVNPSQGAAVVQHSCDIDSSGNFTNRAQQWDAICKDASCSNFHVVNHESLLCLDARGGATNGTPIQMWPCNSISNENWDYGANHGENGSPNFVLRSRVSGTRSHCLDVPGSQDVDGLAMRLWGCNGTAAQLWTSGPPVIE